MPGMHSPAPYPLLIVSAQALPSSSTAETCAVDGEPGQRRQPAGVDGVEQRLAVGLEVVGEVVHVGAVGQHGPLHLERVGPRPVAAAGELAEHHRQQRPADRGRRVAGDVPVADVGAVRGAHDRRGTPRGRPR